MKEYFIAFAILVIAAFQNLEAYGAQSIPSSEAESYIGKYMTVCGNVAKVVKLKKRTVINIGGNYPNEDIYFLIWDSDINAFNNKFGNLNRLANHNLCASGTIEVYKNHLQIVVSDPSNIN